MCLPIDTYADFLKEKHTAELQVRKEEIKLEREKLEFQMEQRQRQAERETTMMKLLMKLANK